MCTQLCTIHTILILAIIWFKKGSWIRHVKRNHRQLYNASAIWCRGWWLKRYLTRTLSVHGMAEALMGFPLLAFDLSSRYRKRGSGFPPSPVVKTLKTHRLNNKTASMPTFDLQVAAFAPIPTVSFMAKRLRKEWIELMDQMFAQVSMIPSDNASEAAIRCGRIGGTFESEFTGW